MAKVISTTVLASAPQGSSAPDSITVDVNSIWVEYGNGADSTGLSGSSTIVQYSLTGDVENTYTLTGLADGLKYDPYTGDIWALLNNDGDAALQIINPATKQVSGVMTYGSGYVYGANSGRGFDDVVFDGSRVFLSETNPANPGDPVIVQLQNGNSPFGTLQTTGIVNFGDTGTNLVTHQKNQTLPITDPDSLKLLPNGDLLLTGEADGAYIFIKDPGTPQQTDSFVTLPSGDVPDDAIMPSASSGTFYISNQGGNDIVKVTVSGLKTGDLYADITNLNELAQIDPNTGVVTPLVTGLNDPHGLSFVPAATPSSDESQDSDAASPSFTLPSFGALPSFGGDAKRTPVVESQHILAAAPAGDSQPDSVTIGAGSTWIEYGNGAPSTGGGTSVVVRYGAESQIENSYTLAGLADGLKYDPVTGDVWALLNQDANAQLVLIDPVTGQVSAPMDYGSGYVYGANSSRGFDDVAFDGGKVFLSETNPANAGDPVVVQLQNGTAPFGTLETTPILKFGDTGTNLVTGQTNQPLPITDPDSLKLLPNGDLLLTGEADGAYIFIKNPGAANQSAAFLTLPAGLTPDDAIMPSSSAGTFTIANNGSLNDVVQVKVDHLNTHDLYADIYSQNELAQIDPTTGSITPIVTGLSSPHGLAFTPSAPSFADIASGFGSDLGGSLLKDFAPTVTGYAGGTGDIGATITATSGGQLFNLNVIPPVLPHNG